MCVTETTTDILLVINVCAKRPKTPELGASRLTRTLLWQRADAFRQKQMAAPQGVGYTLEIARSRANRVSDSN